MELVNLYVTNLSNFVHNSLQVVIVAERAFTQSPLLTILRVKQLKSSYMQGAQIAFDNLHYAICSPQAKVLQINRRYYQYVNCI